MDWDTHIDIEIEIDMPPLKPAPRASPSSPLRRAARCHYLGKVVRYLSSGTSKMHSQPIKDYAGREKARIKPSLPAPIPSTYLLFIGNPKKQLLKPQTSLTTTILDF